MYALFNSVCYFLFVGILGGFRMCHKTVIYVDSPGPEVLLHSL